LLHHILFAQLISTSQNTRLRGAWLSPLMEIEGGRGQPVWGVLTLHAPHTSAPWLHLFIARYIFTNRYNSISPAILRELIIVWSVSLNRVITPIQSRCAVMSTVPLVSRVYICTYAKKLDRVKMKSVQTSATVAWSWLKFSSEKVYFM
jgi:hypothetical protein